MSRPEAGDRIPGLWIPKSKTAVTLILHPKGAAAARESKAAAEAIAAGRSVLFIDAYQTGTAVAPRNTSARHFLTFNRTNDANRVQDVITALAFLKQSGAQDIKVVGLETAAIWARFAAALANTPLKLDADLATFKGTDEQFVEQFFIPGIQRAGGLQAARILTKGM
jgi:dienelactone hydrolase